MGHMAKNGSVLKFESKVDPFLDAAAEHERDTSLFAFSACFLMPAMDAVDSCELGYI